MARLQVTCITKPDPYNRHTRIQALGGVDPMSGYIWRYTENQVINFIQTGNHTFFVNTGYFVANVIVAYRAPFDPYLKTDADGVSSDNLLSLPQCP